MAVYLLHSTIPLRRASGVEVRHYVGYCRDGHVEERVKLHRSHRARVPIVRAYKRLGAQLLLARVWATGTREDEKRIKWAGHHEEICPVCSPERANAGDVGAWRNSRPRR